MLLTPLKEQPSILQNCASPPAQAAKPPPQGEGPMQDAQQNLDGSQNSFCYIYLYLVPQATAVELLFVEDQTRLHLERC